MEFDLIQYYCREKYFHTMRSIAENAIRNRPDDAVMKLQYCTALILENRIGEALRELELFASRGDTELAVIVAMIHAQNLCDVPDTEAIFDLENRLKVERRRATEFTLYYAANLYLQLRIFDKARELAELIFRLNQSSVRGWQIKGWLELNDGKLTVAADCFRTVLSQESENFNAALGEIHSLSADDAVHRLNQLIVKHPKLTPPLMEKMKLLLANRDWDQCAEFANRILEIDETNILALQFRILYNLCARGDIEYVHGHYDELISACRKLEPNNWFLYFEFGQILCRTGGKNADLLRISIKFLEETLNLQPNNVAANIEMANQYYLLGNYQKSVDICKKVALIDDSATEALIGLIKCRLIDNGLNEEIKQQIDFLLEVYNKDTNPDLLVLQATNEAENVAAKLLQKAIELKFMYVDNLRFGVKFLITLDATFILDVLQRNSFIDKSFQVQVLKKLTGIIPGLLDLWLLLAKVHIDSNENTDAEQTLKHIIDNLDSSNTDANLNLALILIRQKRYREAESTLELCLSQNLNVRTKPLFHFLMGKIKKQKNNYAECIDSMLNAVNYMTETDQLKSLDLASLYLDLSQSYQMMRQPTQASEAIQKATLLLEGSPQEDQILIARADLELWKNNADLALSLLSSITPKSSSYQEAHMKIAEIHLKYNKDSLKFVECYKKLADTDPSPENLIKLAEAYFSIRKINDAVEVYERVLRKKHDPKLCKKLAELYCKCHQYDKAMRCYSEAGPEGSMDLAQLLFRMEQWESAEMTLAHVPLLDKALLLSKIKEKLGDIPSAISILSEVYQKVSRNNDSVAAQFCCQMAEYEANLSNIEAAIRHYKQALVHCERNESDATSIQISLSKLYLQINDWSSCQSICSSLLSKDADNEMALLVSGDLSFRKCDFLSASNLFHKLLSKKPDYWLALVRIIEVKRRMGVLLEVDSYLKTAFEVNSTDPGLAYCSGLFHWFNGDLNEAIAYFSAVKHDPEWGQQALYNMVEIYLSGLEDHETAQSVLEEIKPNSSEEETNRNLLVNFVLLASKDKQLVEKAMNEFTALGSCDVLRVGASLGLAMGYMLQKQPQRSRNVLKIIAKTAWLYEEAEYLERCWLLLAEHYVQSGKHELAFELIKKILNYNLGSTKAHELYGMIAEKDHKYGDPIAHYQKAWMLNNHSDQQLGHRLASLYLKQKRYADSISVTHSVLKKHPDFWKIKKEVYEKSLALLRT